ncbi:MAG TPA: helix-turn-helix domain-containing protein [Burkholderiales bacterium]|nr:helix-turn-helix domain-containing protein [Burkholderiales bacterium]
MTSMVEGRELEMPREEGIGEILARERAVRGLTIEDVAQQLKFGARQLEALEQDRFDLLPGGTFARGMVRSYAKLLKLDAESLLTRMEGKLEVPDPGRLADRFRQPVPFANASRRSNVIYGILSLLILAAVAGVLIEWKQERAKVAGPAAVASAPAQVEKPRAADAVAPAEPAPPAPSAPTAAAVQPSVVPAAVQAPAAMQSAQDVAKAQKPPVAKAAPSADPDARRIVMRFDEESWVEVRDAAGHTLLEQLVPAGSQRVVSGQPPFDMVIGNAQHVQVTYQNQPFDLKPHTRVDVARFTLK